MPTHAELRVRFKGLPVDQTPDAWRVRLHRALSWLGRADAETDDPDARFLFLWIALNAAYSREMGTGETERDRLREFLARLVGLDTAGRLHGTLFGQFTGPIRTLIENKCVYQPF
jgi:predicted nucleotidyltransferase